MNIEVLFYHPTSYRKIIHLIPASSLLLYRFVNLASNILEQWPHETKNPLDPRSIKLTQR